MFYISKLSLKYNRGFLYFLVTFILSTSKQDSWSIRLLLLCKKEPHPFFLKYSKNILSQVIVVENNSGVEEEASQVVWNETTNGGTMWNLWKCKGANFRRFCANFRKCYVFFCANFAEAKSAMVLLIPPFPKHRFVPLLWPQVFVSTKQWIDHWRQGGRSCTGGTRRKVWTWTKILSPNMRYFVAN